LPKFSEPLHILGTMGNTPPVTDFNIPEKRTISTAPLQRPENNKNKIMKLQRSV
jgi:hypothetical protein